MTRVFLVDDNPLIRRLYVREIEEVGDFSVCGMAASFAEALEELPAARPDVAIVDIRLEREARRGGEASDGLELIRRLRASMKEEAPRWLVVSSLDDPATIRQAHEAGADAFLPKHEAKRMLVATLRKVLRAGGA